MKESEWIISPKKLKENQKKVFEIEKEMKEEKEFELYENISKYAAVFMSGMTLAAIIFWILM